MDRFGAEAVFGRAPGGGELRRLVEMEQFVSWWKEYRAATDKGTWAESNPAQMQMILQVMAARGDYGG